MAGLHMKKHSAKIREYSHWCLVFSDSEKKTANEMSWDVTETLKKTVS